jgi:hypothetical protein
MNHVRLSGYAENSLSCWSKSYNKLIWRSLIDTTQFVFFGDLVLINFPMKVENLFINFQVHINKIAINDAFTFQKNYRQKN